MGDAGLGEEAGGTAAERPVVSATQVPELEFSVIFPRRKTVNANGKGDDGEPVFVTREFITPYFKMPMVAACAELGVCPTAMKKACRKLGIVKWPYRQTVAALRHTKAASSPTAGVAIDAQGGAGQPGGQQQGMPQGAELLQAQIFQQRQSQQHQEQLQRHQLTHLQVLVRGSMAPAPKRALPLPPPLSSLKHLQMQQMQQQTCTYNTQTHTQMQQLQQMQLLRMNQQQQQLRLAHEQQMQMSEQMSAQMRMQTVSPPAPPLPHHQ